MVSALAKAKETKVGNTVASAFGAKNRARLLDQYFSDHSLRKAADAWKHVYRLLLWIDQSTGLAHCYESDKTQPGKHWYPRALAFHDWVAKTLNASPHQLANEVDWLFRRATLDLAKYVLANQARVIARAKEQRKPYEGKGFPEPGEDRELISIVQDVLGDYLGQEPPEEKWRELVQRIRQYVSLENKRKNLVGEGFEDVLTSVITHAAPKNSLDISARRILQTVPGFKNQKTGDKPNKVDVVVLRPRDGKRTLVTAKWSIRADREKQFPAEFSGYVNANSNLKPFDYVLITNEYDPARLVRACEAMAANAHMFAHVVHINTDALKATYGNSPEDSMKSVVDYISAGRLTNLGDWITTLNS